MRRGGVLQISTSSFVSLNRCENLKSNLKLISNCVYSKDKVDQSGAWAWDVVNRSIDRNLTTLDPVGVLYLSDKSNSDMIFRSTDIGSYLNAKELPWAECVDTARVIKKVLKSVLDVAALRDPMFDPNKYACKPLPITSCTSIEQVSALTKVSEMANLTEREFVLFVNFCRMV